MPLPSDVERIDAKIAEMQATIRDLEAEKVELARREKQMELLKDPYRLLPQVDKFSDKELAAKCRQTRLGDIFELLGGVLNTQTLNLPIGLHVQSLDRVFFALDHLNDDFNG